LLAAATATRPAPSSANSDTNRCLSSSDVGFAMPGGVFVGPNLTPDKETGLGNWTTEEIIVAITKGRAARQACARADHAIKQPFKPDALRCAGNRCLPAEPAARAAQGARTLRPERDAKRVCHVRAARRGLREAAKAAAMDLQAEMATRLTVCRLRGSRRLVSDTEPHA
jgi:hypothetical protein